MWRRRLYGGIGESDIGELLRSSWSAPDKCLEPLFDVEDKDNEILVTVDLPCVKKEEIDIRVTDDSVEIGAMMQKTMRFENWGMIQREVEFRGFRKAISLPEKVNPEAASASFRTGILKITLPKAKRKFKIEVG